MGSPCKILYSHSDGKVRYDRIEQRGKLYACWPGSISGKYPRPYRVFE
jgi:hypothetical protein